MARPSVTLSWRSFAWAFLAVGLSIGAWSVSTPLGAAPDEQGHVIEAAAAVRGQFTPPKIELVFLGSRKGEIGLVGLPTWVARNSEDGCFIHRPNVPAGCAPPISTDTRPVIQGTQFSNYPPLYYVIVGIPTLLSVGSGALYGMQYTGALLDAAVIALGLFLLVRYHPRRLTLLGALVALSPMVLFISAVVNSSGLETATAFAAWCGGLCVVQAPEVSRGLAAWTSLSFVLLILSRPISPVNAAVIVVVLATLVGWRRSRELLRAPSVRPLFISGLLATVLAAFYFLMAGLPDLLRASSQPPVSFTGGVWLTLRLTGQRLRQCVGDFGWLDTPAPLWVVVIWAVALVGLLVCAIVVSRRARFALPLLAVAIVLMPVVFESPQINTVGTYWQGRYWLPLMIGLPLVASSVLPRTIFSGAPSDARSRSWRTAGLAALGALLVAAQVGAFLTALRRYETGLGTKPAGAVDWAPPGGGALVISLFVAGQILLLGFLAWKFAHPEKVESVAAAPEESPLAESVR
jgi:Predicted membrane protein (DUF2142)